MDLGDVPTWISAIIAVGALATAWLGYRSLKKQVDDQRAELKRQAGERRQDQVSRVFVIQQPERRAEGAAVFVTVDNKSELPVYDIQVNFREGGRPVEVTVVNGTDRQPVMAPGGKFTCTATNDTAGEIDADLVFRDSAGVWWRRDSQGQITDCGSDQPAAG
jgi:hypothetical protein